MLFRRIGLLLATVFRHLYLSLASLSFCTTYFNFSTSLRLLRSHWNVCCSCLEVIAQLFAVTMWCLHDFSTQESGYDNVCFLTYFLTPLRACSHIGPTLRNAIVICPLPTLRPGPNSTREPSSLAPRTDLLHVSFDRPLLLFPAGVQRMATIGIDVGGIMLTWPIHLHLLFFISNAMGSIPDRSWSYALAILFGQKMCRILLRHLFWNTSSVWHIPLTNFQDYAAYVALENAYLCFFADNFRCPDVLQSRKCPPCLVDPCLDFSLCVSTCCHFCSQVWELCYVFYVVFSESDWVFCLTVISHCFGFVFVDTSRSLTRGREST